MAAQYGMEADKLKEYIGDNEKESMKRDLAVTKAVDLIMENVKERAKAKSKKEKRSRRERGNRGVIPLSVLIAKQTDWLYWAGLFKLISNY